MDRKEALKKYGEVILKFQEYYKYTFTFMGENKEVKIIGYFGGDADDIYRYDVSRDTKIKFANDNFGDVVIVDKKTDEIICEWYQNILKKNN